MRDAFVNPIMSKAYIVHHLSRDVFSSVSVHFCILCFMVTCLANLPTKTAASSNGVKVPSFNRPEDLYITVRCICGTKEVVPCCAVSIVLLHFVGSS